jgi:hypothetical protein
MMMRKRKIISDSQIPVMAASPYKGRQCASVLHINRLAEGESKGDKVLARRMLSVPIHEDSKYSCPCDNGTSCQTGQEVSAVCPIIVCGGSGRGAGDTAHAVMP